MIIAYIGIVGLTTYLGYSFSKSYLIKFKIYKQLYNFLNFYKLEVGYSQKKISEIINKFIESEKNDLISLKEFLSYLKDGYLNENGFKFKTRINELSNVEQEEIEEIYNDLGKYDLIQEKEKIELLINRVNNKLNEALANKNKYYNLCIKVGIIIGCFVVLLLI